MYCINCGKSLPDTATACPKCHARVVKPQSVNTKGDTSMEDLAQAVAATPNYRDNPLPSAACQADIHTAHISSLSEFLLTFSLCSLPVIGLLFAPYYKELDSIGIIILSGLALISLTILIVFGADRRKPNRSNACRAVLLFLGICIVISVAIVGVRTFMGTDTNFIKELRAYFTDINNFIGSILKK